MTKRSWDLATVFSRSLERPLFKTSVEGAGDAYPLEVFVPLVPLNSLLFYDYQQVLQGIEDLFVYTELNESNFKRMDYFFRFDPYEVKPFDQDPVGSPLFRTLPMVRK